MLGLRDYLSESERWWLEQSKDTKTTNLRKTGKVTILLPMCQSHVRYHARDPSLL